MIYGYAHKSRIKEDDPCDGTRMYTDIQDIIAAPEIKKVSIKNLSSFGTTSTRAIARAITTLLGAGITVALSKTGVNIEPGEPQWMKFLNELGRISTAQKIDTPLMRKMIENKETITGIAEHFGIARQTVYAIWARDFPDLKRDFPVTRAISRARQTGKLLGRPPGGSKVNPDVLTAMLSRGSKVPDIAEHFNVCVGTVYYAIRRHNALHGTML
jgi:hypothetical protein